MADQLVPRRVDFNYHSDGVQYGNAALNASRDAHGSDAQQPSSEKHNQLQQRVTLLTCGQAHTACTTDDGRFWMMGMRGRGRLYDDSNSEGASPAVRPALSSTPPGLASIASGLDVPVNELFMQTQPLEVPRGPVADEVVVRMRSSKHYSYAITASGRVFRFGWRGIMSEISEAQGLRVDDIALGHVHGLLLVSDNQH